MLDDSRCTAVSIPSALVLGRYIRAARIQKGLTQRALAKLLFCSLRWITEVENGKDTAQIGKVIGLCQFLDLQVQLAIPSRSGNLSEKGSHNPDSHYPDLDTIMEGYS